jgi:putative hydrolase of the HAD superfamily
MSEQNSPEGNRSLQLRILVAVPRSGSTLLMRSFAQNAACGVTSRLVTQGNRDVKSPFKPDYSIFGNPHLNKVYKEALERQCGTLITKEELGHEEWKGECDFDVLPRTALHESTKPAFLFRDPLRIYDSRKALGWDHMSSFLTAYRNLARMWSESPESTSCVYEELVRNQELVLRRLCEYWNLEFTDKMLELTQPMENFLFSSEREKSIYTTHNPAGIFDTVKSHDTITPEIKSHKLLTKKEIEVIDGQLTPHYLDSCGDSVRTLSAVLHDHSWYGFDLDDTLHEFRKASKAAAVEVFKHISSHSEIPAHELAASYSEILTQKTASAFTDGRTSDDYRKERFGALLEKHGLGADEDRLILLAALYKDELAIALESKAGALTLLPYLRSIGKKVAIITEGPQDAQEWTIEKLGLSKHLDELVTTNKFGKSKTDGLFPSVLSALGIEGKDMVYIGDNYARDIVPAQEQGITTIHFSEAENVVLSEQGTRVNSLLKIENILRLRDRKSKYTVTE